MQNDVCAESDTSRPCLLAERVLFLFFFCFAKICNSTNALDTSPGPTFSICEEDIWSLWSTYADRPFSEGGDILSPAGECMKRNKCIIKWELAFCAFEQFQSGGISAKWICFVEVGALLHNVSFYCSLYTHQQWTNTNWCCRETCCNLTPLQTESPIKLLTFGDHALQPDDVGMIKLTHDGRLTQEVSSLSLHVAALQCLYCHGNLLLPRCSQAATANFSKLP